MQDDPTTDETDHYRPQLLMDEEDWQIAFKPYEGRPSDALSLGCKPGDAAGVSRRANDPMPTWPRLLLPELVFFPKELDFPRTRKPEGAIFIEASVDVERRDADFPWDWLDEEKPLVYCTLGTVVPFKAPARVSEFFRCLWTRWRNGRHYKGW